MSDLVKEYDRFYTKDPNRWNMPERDREIFDCISRYGEPETLLEVGCGNGHLVAYILDRWPGAACIGLDFSPVAVRVAKQKAPGAEFVCMDIQDYKPGTAFDMILLSGVAEHFDDPLKKLAHVRGLLKPDGIVYLEVPNCIAYPSFKGDREGYFRINQGSRQMEWHYKRETWERVILEAGFEIAESIKGSQPYWEFIWILTR